MEVRLDKTLERKHPRLRRLIYPALLLGLVLATALLLTGTTLAEPARWYVNDDATGANDGTSWTDAFTDLQSALSVATSGDQIWVAAGTYKPTDGTDRTISFTLREGVALYGGFAGTETALEQRDWTVNLTILSGNIGAEDWPFDNSNNVVRGADNAVLDGFTVREGVVLAEPQGAGMSNYYSSPTVSNCSFSGNWGEYGGGMYNLDSSPTLSNCSFTGDYSTEYGGDIFNSAVYGGGMYNLDSSPTLTNVTFTENSGIYGGGIYNDVASFPTLSNCTFSGNSASDGGGIYNNGSFPTLSNCTFSGNSASGGLNMGYYGGAMYNLDSSPTLNNCLFSANSATHGGGMHNRTSSPMLNNCTFCGNLADGGGGMYNKGSSPTLSNCIFSSNSSAWAGGGIYNSGSSPTLSNCIFFGNKAVYDLWWLLRDGGGMYNWHSSPTLNCCTFSGNLAESGAGMYNVNSSLPTLSNCILWGDIGGEVFCDNPTHYPESSATVAYSIVQGGWDGTGNLDADPVFVDAASGDLHLQASSPAIDAGTNAGAPVFDLDGVTRPQDGDGDGIPEFDMGAYEYYCLDPATLIEALAQFIIGLADDPLLGGIAPEIEGSLLVKLNAALAALAKDNPNAAKVAMNDLRALINQVEAQTDKKIAPEAAAETITQANAIIAALGG